MKIKMNLPKILIVVVLALVGAGGCSSGQATKSSIGPIPALSIKLSADAQPVFNSTCVVCHQGVGQAGLSLEPGKAYANLVGVKSTESPLMRVLAGAPDQSYLINKLQGTQVQAGGQGAQMPLNGTSLSSAQIELIRQWISQGALNN
jgi:mono/diheme cytochrome c family protein